MVPLSITPIGNFEHASFYTRWTLYLFDHAQVQKMYFQRRA